MKTHFGKRQDDLFLRIRLAVAKFASNSIVALALPPETLAIAPFEGEILGQSDELVGSVGESAFVTVVAEADFGVGLAHFGFMLEGVGLAESEVPLEFIGAVALSDCVFVNVASLHSPSGFKNYA